MEVTALVLSICALLISAAIVIVLIIQRKRSRARWGQITTNVREVLRRTESIVGAMSQVQRDVSRSKRDVELLIERLRNVEKGQPALMGLSDRNKRDIELLIARIRTVEKESVPALNERLISARREVDDQLRRLQDLEAGTIVLKSIVEALQKPNLPSMPRTARAELDLSDAMSTITDPGRSVDGDSTKPGTAG